ncbi:NFACT family protein [Candidatus Woesearchaeota archaeon]|nr:NFACT family protein [Candidatus Woesearchaeota archaeon]
MLEYKYPKMGYNFLSLKIEDMKKLFENSKTENVVKCLAVELGFGGVYSEEICLLSNIDKNIDPKRIDEKTIKKIHSTINKIINNKINAKIILKNNEIADVNPFELEFYKDCEKKDFGSFSEALNFFYSHFKPKIKSEYEKRIEKLHRIMEEQKKAIDEMNVEEVEARAKGESIYHNYQQIKEILDELNSASRKYSWKEIKEKLKGHKVVKDINEKDRKVIVEI